jgi:hypothetical protein
MNAQLSTSQLYQLAQLSHREHLQAAEQARLAHLSVSRPDAQRRSFLKTLATILIVAGVKRNG